MSLEEWRPGARVDAAGPKRIELYAVDADPHQLMAALLPGGRAWIVDASAVELVSGRLVAQTRAEAAATLLEQAGLGGTLQRLPRGRRAPVAVQAVRASLRLVADEIAHRSGTEVLVAMHHPTPITVLARAASPDLLLPELAQLVGAAVTPSARGWLLHDRERGDLGRIARSGGPVVSLVVEGAHSGDAIGLLSEVTAVPREAQQACGGAPVSGRAIDAQLGLVLAWLAVRVPPRRGPCLLPLWQGSPSLLDARVVAIAWHSRHRAAALLRFPRHGLAIVRQGQNGRARADIDPSALVIRQSGQVILEQAVEPRDVLLGELEPVVPFVEPAHWRLAATLREGASWRALLTHTRLEWHWVEEDNPVVRLIEHDRVVLAPARPGEPALEMRLTPLAGHER